MLIRPVYFRVYKMIYTKIDEKDITEDKPLVMYIIIRESLGMSPGKLCAQVGHGIQIILDQYDILDELSQRSPNSAAHLTEEECNIIARMDLWKDSKKSKSGIRKVSLAADDKEWEKIKTEFGNNLALVIDAGLTQIQSGSETIIVLYPLLRGENKIVKRLQVLK